MSSILREQIISFKFLAGIIRYNPGIKCGSTCRESAISQALSLLLVEVRVAACEVVVFQVNHCCTARYGLNRTRVRRKDDS